MKQRGKNLALVLAGILIGCAISGPAASAAEEWYKAYKSGRNFYIDGEQVEMDAYAVQGNNYVKLRDIAELVGFEVWWDEENRTVQIERDKPYTGEPPTQVEPEPTESLDYAADVNPAALTGAYTSEAYAALRRTVATGGESAPVAMSEETRAAMLKATAAIGSWPGYHMKTTADGKASFYTKYPSSYEEAAAYCQPFIDSLDGLTDREKARQIAFFVCDRITYDATTYCSPRTALVSDKVCRGACMSYDGQVVRMGTPDYIIGVRKDIRKKSARASGIPFGSPFRSESKRRLRARSVVLRGQSEIRKALRCKAFAENRISSLLANCFL